MRSAACCAKLVRPCADQPERDRMTSSETTAELRFDPPGPGSWGIDAVHFPRPVTRYWQEMHPEPFRRGFREFTSYYGMLIDGLEYAYINGFCYSRMVP